MTDLGTFLEAADEFEQLLDVVLHLFVLAIFLAHLLVVLELLFPQLLAPYANLVLQLSQRKQLIDTCSINFFS